MITSISPESEKWDWFCKVLRPKVNSMLDSLGSKSLYYEVAIDLEEQFDKFGEYVFKFPNLAAYNIARWMIKRDKWYWSPEYVNELNACMDKGASAVDALNSVLSNSLKR